MNQPTLGPGGYPTEETLATISSWPICNNSDIAELLGFVESIWTYRPFAIRTEGDGKDRYIYVATSGWSGNESIIAALEQNMMFWLLCWLESRRGGGYKFLTQPLKDK